MSVLDSTNVIIDGRVVEVTGQVGINYMGISNEGTPVYAGGVKTRIDIKSDITSNMYEITVPFSKTFANEVLITALNRAGIDQKDYKMTIQFKEGSFNFKNVFAKQGANLEGGETTIEVVLVAMRID